MENLSDDHSDDDSDTSSDDECSAREGVYGDIQDALTNSANIFGSRDFLPADKMGALITRLNIESILAEANGNEAPSAEIIQFTMEKAPRTFLTLVYINAARNFGSIYKDGFHDEFLPIGHRKMARKSSKKTFRWEVASLNRTTHEFDAGHFYEAFKTWDNNVVEAFEANQWLFLTPVFSKDTFHYKFHIKQPLPFLSDGSQKPGEGHFSLVHKAKVHSAYQDSQVFRQLGAAVSNVAIKEFRPHLKDFFYRELSTLQTIRGLTHKHLIKPIVALEKGETRCVVFPWADGGNLRDFWKQEKGDNRNDAMITWAIEQMRGISEALMFLYNDNGRHGDLKPENILRFIDSDSGNSHLVIADVGLTKFHVLATQERRKNSSITSRTLRYEAPEMNVDDPTTPRSRDYDVWSMGCIFLEFVIWILYGANELERFNVNGQYDKFWHYQNGVYTLHVIVERMIQRILGDLPSKSALRDVVEMIHEHLLVITLAKDAISPETGRWTAPELSRSMDQICKASYEDPSYRFGDRAWQPARGPSTTGSSLVVPKFVSNGPTRHSLTDVSTSIHGNGIGDNTPSITVEVSPDNGYLRTSNLALRTNTTTQQARQLENVWKFESDDKFARNLLEKLDWSKVKPAEQDTSLCDECKAIAMNIRSMMQLSMELPKLQLSSQNCELCKLFYECLSNTPIQGGIVRLFLDGSTLRLGEKGHPVVSVYTNPDRGFSADSRIGFPQLPEARSEEELILLREWIHNCDENHNCVPKTVSGEMPTRLIDVFASSKDGLQLVETDKISWDRYVALSHCWGKIPHNEKFCLYNDNLVRLKDNIEYKKLPKTFRDAVDVARELKVRYIWIDSVCILQDNTKDWEFESARMESVFSSAYCTIAATSAESSTDGFPDSRSRRRCVQAGNLYFAEAIDDFHADVEAGILNTRGWVFQEHALSRRSIHFTSNQIYWECGQGIHCETLAKLHNPQAAFLGDSDFPKAVREYFKGGRILHFQGLFQMYSRLEFTKSTDRSVALQGLEQRLATTLKTRVKFGILEGFLERSLLWQAAVPTSMSRIPYSAVRNVPSWTWMAHLGSIKYEDVPFDETDWCTENLKNPFTIGGPRQPHCHRGSSALVELPAFARELVISSMEFSKRVTVDGVASANLGLLKCVVIGKEKAGLKTDDQTHYVMVIKPLESSTREDIYERAGIGRILGRHISEAPGFWVRIL